MKRFLFTLLSISVIANFIFAQDIEEVVESDNRLRPGCSAAFSVVVDNDEVLVVIAELRNAKEKGADQIAADARQRVSQDHGVQVHTLVLIKPRTVEKTSSGKIARSWAKKAYLNNDLQALLDPLTFKFL